MFLLPLVMSCSHTEYETSIKPQLLKMGYIEIVEDVSSNSTPTDCYVITGKSNPRYMKLIKEPLDIFPEGHFHLQKEFPTNLPLFYALAGMTRLPLGNYGEYWILSYKSNFDKSTVTSIKRQEHLNSIPEGYRKASMMELIYTFGLKEIPQSINYPEVPFTGIPVTTTSTGYGWIFSNPQTKYTSMLCPECKGGTALNPSTGFCKRCQGIGKIYN